MNRLIALCVVLSVLLVVSGCKEGETPGAAAQAQGQVAASQPAPVGQAAPEAAKPSATEGEIVLTLQIPAAGTKAESAPLSGHGGSCPMGAMSGLLGVEITNPHGLIIGRVVPNSPADKAGLRTGDSVIKIDGQAVTCPRKCVPFLKQGDKPREVKLTVIRPNTSPAGKM